MRILLVNDDGIHAPGLDILEDIARQISDDVWIVAPDIERSGMSRALTLSDPIRVRKIKEKRFSCSGTPTDCVLLGVLDLVKGKKPDLILSGVNRGQNLAEDVTVSGTVAGAVQGMQMGIPSMALSQSINYHLGEDVNWDVAKKHGADVVKRLIAHSWPQSVVMNVNFPPELKDNTPIIEATFQGMREEDVNHLDRREDLRGNDYYWLGYNNQDFIPPLGSDLRAINEGHISITPLHIDLTSHQVLNALKKEFLFKGDDA
ncbi:MAG: 5'/3'-nucleotidase SurE [Caulobacterales bacterium]|nr:5'/3'-nucleotidase SurE [Caulobacterales bacterium]MCA0372539.1 5'/3'-nucleotidase SurE [Pseudomonadota bacterium]